jgi:hypothetical protein
MKEPSELEKLNAVAQEEAGKNALKHLRGSRLVFYVVIIGIAVFGGALPLERAALRTLAVLMASALISIHFDWRYAPVSEKAITPLMCGMCLLLVRHGLYLAPWFEVFIMFAWIAAFVDGAVDTIRIARAIRIANSPACLAERETIGRWISQLTSAIELPGIIHFAADDFWSDGRVVVKLLQQDNWLVLASLLKVDPTKMLTLSIFDARSTPISYSREQSRLRIGDRKFRKVESTPELTALTSQLAHEGPRF